MAGSLISKDNSKVGEVGLDIGIWSSSCIFPSTVWHLSKETARGSHPKTQQAYSSKPIHIFSAIQSNGDLSDDTKCHAPRAVWLDGWKNWTEMGPSEREFGEFPYLWIVSCRFSSQKDHLQKAPGIILEFLFMVSPLNLSTLEKNFLHDSRWCVASQVPWSS